ncbi:MAG: tRNA lysidine(34) synthetase TilS [Desulfofustis sp.]|nr:tRNA lysidine(34) synthetase TilS [Desulfofustis sp.]
MTPLHSSLLHAINRHRLINGGEHLVVGVSGGSDSVALLCLLADLLTDCRLTATYVDHGLRPAETTNERQLVRQLCRDLKLDCRIVDIDVAGERQRSGESLEACARRLRYQALEQVRIACGAELIAVGHTSDDQAEEVLIRLIRGTGLQGLAGMAWKNGRIIRPLLGIGKQELVDYLRTRGIAPCLDSSNLSEQFLRNRVRLDLLPLLERRYNNAIRKSLCNTATILAGDDDCLQGMVDAHYATLVAGTPAAELTLSLSAFGTLHLALQRRLLEKICWQSGSRPSFLHIENLLSLIASGDNGASLDLPAGLCARKSGQDLVFSVTGADPRTRHRAAFGPPLTIAGDGIHPVPSLSTKLELTLVAGWQQCRAQDLLIDADRAPFPWILREPLAGERFVPLGAPGSKKVSRLLSDRKVPRHQRHRYPVLSCDGAIFALPGLVIADGVKVTAQTSRFLAIGWRDNED